MYNLRYHIASLVGVFIALSLGLLLGTIVAERGTLDDQRDTLINNLEQDFKELSERNDELEAENEAREDFVEDIVPEVVSGSLAGKNVLIIANSGRSDGMSAVEQAVEDAGGIPCTVMLLEPRLALDSQEMDSVIDGLELSGNDISRSVAASLAAEWSQTSPDRPVTDALVSAGVLRVEGLPAGTAAHGVVTIAAWEQEPDEVAISLAAALGERAIPAAGAQAVSLDTGVALAAVDAGLSAVDQMGRPEGAYALAKILSGAVTGYYGTGSGAIAPYPRP